MTIYSLSIFYTALFLLPETLFSLIMSIRWKHLYFFFTVVRVPIFKRAHLILDQAEFGIAPDELRYRDVVFLGNSFEFGIHLCRYRQVVALALNDFFLLWHIASLSGMLLPIKCR